MTTLQTSEVLDLAADQIRERGWRTGGGWNGTSGKGAVCLEGGIMAAMGMTFASPDSPLNEEYEELTECAAYQAVREYLELPETTNPWSWNDLPERTEDEVVEVLRAAAAVERVKEATLVACPA